MKFAIISLLSLLSAIQVSMALPEAGSLLHSLVKRDVVATVNASEVFGYRCPGFTCQMVEGSRKTKDDVVHLKCSRVDETTTDNNTATGLLWVLQDSDAESENNGTDDAAFKTAIWYPSLALIFNGPLPPSCIT